ncbi:MAG: FkbM family methyltransferase [Bacteroidia bacterium]|nr:FkbM family methyltransferase [Bacteroidia bacterium]
MFIKQALYKILGVRNYLIVVSRLFFISYSLRFLKKNKTFDCHYFIKNLINEGDYVIDIGANLGYYSRLFAQLIGPNGKVFSVEPVTLFRKILKINTSGFRNTTIIPYALGTEDNKPIVMGIPKSNKYLRHGLTRVLDTNENEPFEFTFNEKMFTPVTLFGKLERCDYIKCDVEGYEIHIIPQLEFLLKPFQPIIQIEIEPVNRKSIVDFLSSLSYSAFYLKDELLFPVEENSQGIDGDLFFIPQIKMKLAVPYLAKLNI